jgi:hypothetical protein
MNEGIVPNEKLWTKDITRRYEDTTHWAILRTKEDSKTGKRYFDVLVGLKGGKPHAHFGINLNQTLRFSEFRKTTHSIGRTVVSKKKGLLEDKALVVDDDVKGGKKLVLKLTMDGPTAEVTIEEFKLA